MSLSQLWGPEFRHEGAGRALLSLKDLGKDPSMLLPTSVVPCIPQIAAI